MKKRFRTSFASFLLAMSMLPFSYIHLVVSNCFKI